MSTQIKNQTDLTKEQNIRLILDFWHRTMMHHAIWYGEVLHQFGREKALDALKTASDNAYNVHLNRLSKVLGFTTEDNLPSLLTQMDQKQLDELKSAVAVNWLATDGVWFQAVEFSRGMNDAKRCNDSAWAQFSPFEAWSVKRFLDLPENCGLEGLKRALNFRLYATINKQSIVDETEKSFVFVMNECRVQSARKRKGLDDYPCKSGGLIEYTSFAEAIDSRIKTECVACPPDKHPDEYYCAWKFYMD